MKGLPKSGVIALSLASLCLWVLCWWLVEVDAKTPGYGRAERQIVDLLLAFLSAIVASVLGMSCLLATVASWKSLNWLTRLMGILSLSPFAWFLVWRLLIEPRLTHQ